MSDTQTLNIRALAQQMQAEEVRSLVDLYYQMQEYRKATANQVRAIQQGADEGEPTVAGAVLLEVKAIETRIEQAMDTWSSIDPLAAWAKSQHGIGPIIASGLAAHIDVTKAQTAGAVWRFAGLDPTLKWGKGEKRPYNARLKVLAWKVGDSFKKQSGSEKCFYGRLYVERKALEVKRNEAGEFAETAKATLAEKKIKEKATRARYEEGKLPDGRLDLRAMRWATKLFLAHYWEEGRRQKGLEVAEPYPIAHMDHAHRIEAPET